MKTTVDNQTLNQIGKKLHGHIITEIKKSSDTYTLFGYESDELPTKANIKKWRAISAKETTGYHFRPGHEVISGNIFVCY